ncbi:MAG: PilZ domain-containing protein [Spirochaetales bacterium]|nr:PilZ domain-containing protein [Spirochaetales bacterium]
MGTTVSRIEKEFILNSVCDNAIPLRLSGRKARAFGRLKSVDEEYVVIGSDEPLADLFRPGVKIRAYFSYFGHVMTFETVVRSFQEEDLKADFPSSVHKNLMRKYERVSPPADVVISFEIQEAKIELAFPKTEEYNSAAEPLEYSDEYDPSDLESLIDVFRERVKRKVDINTVTMFRERKPQNFEERLVVQTGKILFIPNTLGRFPENDYEMGGRIITRAMMLSSGRAAGESGESQDALPQLLAEKRERGIKAEIYCPIIYHEYAVGIIYLAQKVGSEAVFDHDLLDETYQFSKILAFSLKANGYFKEHERQSNSYSGDIIDISASGILFANASKELDQTLALYADIDLSVRFGERTMRIGARVMRKLSGAKSSYYGIQFMDIKPEDFRFIFEYVYGRSITVEDEQMWEGGTPPPALKFD